jgi:membrane fusion protein, multidrug efflux system
MMSDKIRVALLVCLGTILMAAPSGCSRGQPQVAPPEPPTVPVSTPVQREITDYVDFTGRADAVQAVDIRPRVTGYLTKVPFKEGAEVKKNDLLFEIDPRPYEAQLAQAQGQLDLAAAQLKLARSNYQRDLAVASKGFETSQHLDQDAATVEESQARVKGYQGTVDVYKLNVEYTKVVSPIDGMVSRYYLTVGNLVNQDQTLLTTVVSLDPMYVYFEVDEPTLLRVRRAVNEGKIQRSPAGEHPVLMGLSGEDGYPHVGKVNFVNNQVNPATGSISVRGVFPNPLPKGGSRLISPGMFVRVREPIGQPHTALLVIDRAVASDQGLKYVYVLDEKNEVQYRRVATGPLQEDGLRVIREGIEPNDRIVVGGLQLLRPRMPVKPEPGPMPVIGPEVPVQVPPPPPGKAPAPKAGTTKG